MQHVFGLTRAGIRYSYPFLRTQRPIKYYANMSAPKAAETDTQAEQMANLTGVTADSIQKKLQEGVQAQHVDIEDMSGRILPTLN